MQNSYNQRERPKLLKRMILLRIFCYIAILMLSTSSVAHPLRLSLCEIEYSPKKQLLSINLKLFLTDVNEALVFDPYSEELAFCQSNESSKANEKLMDYVNQFFYVKANRKIIDLKIKRKRRRRRKKK